jgi:ribosomal protein S21
MMSKRYKESSYATGICVEVRDDFNRALRTFSKKVQDSGMLKDLKDRMSYEPKSVEKQRKKKMARKRWEKKVEGMIESGLWHSKKPY